MPSKSRPQAIFLLKTSPVRKIFQYLPKTEKKSIFIKSILIIVGNFLDLLGVFLFGIIGSIVLNAKNPLLSNLSSRIPGFSQFEFGQEDSSKAQIILISIVLLFFILKTAIGMLGNKLLFDALSRIATNQSVMTLAHVRKYPISKFNSISVSDLQFLATQSTQSAIYDCLGYSILIFAEICLLTSLGIFYVIVTGAVGLATVVYFVCCIYLTQNYISTRMKTAENQRIQAHINSLEMIRGQASIASYLHDDSVFNWFRNKIIGFRFREFQSISKLQFLGNLPKFSLEILLILGIFLSGILQWFINPANLYISLGLFFVTSLRFMPSLARLQAYYNQLLRGMQGSELYLTIIDKKSSDSIHLSEIHESFNSDSLLVCHDLEIYIDGKFLLSAENINFPRRGLIAFVGKSGSGKSTLLNLLSGYDNLNAESKGRILYNVIDSKKILVSQFTTLLPLSLHDNIYLDLEKSDAVNKNFDGLVNQLGLTRLITQTIDDPYNLEHLQLSGGELQRIGILRAFLRQANAYFLDEPTASLDELNRSKVWELLKAKSKDSLVVVTTHDSNVSDFAETIYCIEDCRVSFSNYE